MVTMLQEWQPYVKELDAILILENTNKVKALFIKLINTTHNYNRHYNQFIGY